MMAVIVRLGRAELPHLGAEDPEMTTKPIRSLAELVKKGADTNLLRDDPVCRLMGDGDGFREPVRCGKNRMRSVSAVQ